MDAPISAPAPAPPAWARHLDALLARPWLPWALVAFGALLRIVRYLSQHALEVSEAELALNVLPRTLGEALAPLHYDQAAPAGFVALLIIAKDLFGPGELALRAPAFAASLVSLPLFVLLARRVLRPAGVSIATAIFAAAPLLVYYGSFAKQYESDALATIVLALLALRVLDERRAAIFVFAIAGAASIWLSHPASFVVAGTGCALAALAFASRDTRRLARLAACGVVFAASFAGFLAASDRGAARNDFLLGYWQAGFLPLPPRSLADRRWFLDRGIGVLEDPGAFFPAGAAAFSLLAGIVFLLRERRDAALLLLAPVPFLLAASALRLYPVHGRLVVFLLPIVVVFVAAGADGVRRAAERTPALAALLLVLLLFDPLASEAKKLLAPPRFEDPRPLLERLSREARPDDSIYVYYDAQFAWRYYAPRYGLDPERAIIGTSAESVWTDDVADIERLRGRPRVWLIFSHAHLRQTPRSEEDFFRFELDRSGRRLAEQHEPGASLYLYDLREPGEAR